MMKLYNFPLSGHAHRVRLMLSLLNLEYERVHVKLDELEHMQSKFSELNPFQQVPVLDDDGFIVRDSVAILCYLATKYAPEWYPQDAESIARVQEWLTIASKEMAIGPASARLVNVFNVDLDHKKAIDLSHQLLTIMDDHLKDRDWLALNNVTIADVAAYSYIAHAPEGDVALDRYSNVLSWLARVEDLERFVPMNKTPVGLAV